MPVSAAGPATARAQPSTNLRGLSAAAPALSSTCSVSTTGPFSARSGTSADVHPRSPGEIGLGPAEHLAGHRRDLAAAEQQEPQELMDRVALGTAPVSSRIRSASAASALGTDGATTVITR